MKVVHGALVVRPSGDLNEKAASEMQGQIQKELEPAPRDIVLNLTGVESIAAGALAYLFRIQKQAHEAENRFVVAGAPESAMRLFRLTNVERSLELVTNEEDALRATVS
jgi:anti-anti-sigma factor